MTLVCVVRALTGDVGRQSAGLDCIIDAVVRENESIDRWLTD